MTLFLSADFVQVACPTDLTNKTGSVRSDQTELDHVYTISLNTISKMAVGVIATFWAIFFLLGTLWVITRRRLQRKLINSTPSNRSERETVQNETGIKKIVEVHYFELGCRTPKTKGSEGTTPALSLDKSLPHLKEPPPIYERHPAMSEHAKQRLAHAKQELEGSTTSESKGNKTRRTILKIILEEASGEATEYF